MFRLTHTHPRSPSGNCDRSARSDPHGEFAGKNVLYVARPGEGASGGCPRGSNVLCEGGVVHDGAVHGVVHGVGVRWWGGAVRWGACGWGGMEFAACNQGLLHGVVSLTTPLSPMPIPGSTKCAVSARVPAATTRSLWRGMAWRYRRWRGRRGCSGEIRGWWGWGCGVCDVRWMAIGAMARAAGLLG